MNGDDYICRQSVRDAEYESAYREWVESLPPEERETLRTNGLDSPVLHRHGSGSANGDAADSPLMSEGCDPALRAEPDDPQDAPQATDDEQVWDVMRRMLGELLSHDNARLTVECLALVSGLPYTGSSMTDIARRRGITRAAVSKRCVELTTLLDLRHHQDRNPWPLCDLQDSRRDRLVQNHASRTTKKV